MGERLGRLPVGPDGSQQELDLIARRTLVAILNPSCSTCRSHSRSSVPRNAFLRSCGIVRQRRGDLAAQHGLAGRVFTLGK